MTDNLDTNKLDTMSTLEDLLIDYETAQSFDIKNTAKQAIEAYIAERERAAYDLLYWKYKELNDQSVDMKFAEAWGILVGELDENGEPKDQLKSNERVSNE